MYTPELANEIAFTALFDLLEVFRIETEKVYLCCLLNARTYLLDSYSVLREAKYYVHILFKGLG